MLIDFKWKALELLTPNTNSKSTNEIGWDGLDRAQPKFYALQKMAMAVKNSTETIAILSDCILAVNP